MNIKRVFAAAFAVAVTVQGAIVRPSAASYTTVLPYENYIYSETDGTAIRCPQAYVPDAVISGEGLEITDFNNASDFDVDNNYCVYILDSSNQRIVVLNSDLQLKQLIALTESATLNDAKGITVTDDKIYICDTENSRIIILNKDDGSLVKIIGAPQSSVLGEDFIFKPAKIAVDDNNDLYVVSGGTYEGIVNLSCDGDFIGFFSGNAVTTSSWDLFWRRFSSVKQKKSMLQLVPQDFSSIDLDDEGFFYITTYTTVNNSMVKRVNPGGNNIIRTLSNIPVSGDPYKIQNGSMAGLSSFGDIAAGPDKIYACLDVTRNRVFCYNNDGYLLYTLGTYSSQLGGFEKPTAVCYIKDRIAVLDSKGGFITVFSPTEYGRLINSGIHLQNNLDYDKATEEWKRVLSMNSNYPLALNMIGKAAYYEEDYEYAMACFKECDNRDMYSKSREALRSQWIYGNIKIILAVLLFLIAAAAVSKTVISVKRKKTLIFNKKKQGDKQ